ncbi:hypothetical protein RJD38_08110 [Vibrio scophthalmi]|uniref:hypothetical protein n=1 Tax=Vibrio scophthalmi TaxID=45658 RepID=UPI00349F151C
MLHKAIAKNDKIKAKGVDGGINYLSGYKWRKVKPELLRGNLDITHQLLALEKSANAYTHGVLSFEENALDVSTEAQEFAMSLFEETLMAGFPPTHYDLVWIRHTDKEFDEARGCGRLELNYHIVNRDLVTGKIITPYLHKRDMHRINLAKQIVNDKFNLTSPDDPSHQRQINLSCYGNENKGVAKKLTEFILDGIAIEKINNRQDIIAALKNHPDVELVRDNQPDNYLVVKLKGAKRNLRLKGTIYDKHQFTSIEQLIERQTEGSREYHQQRDRRCEQNIKELRALNYQVAQQRAQLIQAKQKRGRKPSSRVVDANTKRSRNVESSERSVIGFQRQNDRYQPESRAANHRAVKQSSPIGAQREFEVGQNICGNSSINHSGFSIRNRRNLPFLGLDFSASLATRNVFGKELTRAQRQWYAVYKKGINQDVVHDAIILDKGGYGATRTIVSQRLNTVIHEYDDLFTISTEGAPEGKKLAYLLTIEAAAAKGWDVSSLKLTTNVGEVSASNKAAFEAAVLQYYKNKGITPPNTIIKKNNNGRTNNNTPKPVSSTASGVREPAKNEQSQPSSFSTTEPEIRSVNDAALQRFSDQARSVATNTESINTKHQYAVQAIERANRGHQPAIERIGERKDCSAELTAGDEQLSCHCQQLAECCRAAIKEIEKADSLISSNTLPDQCKNNAKLDMQP